MDRREFLAKYGALAAMGFFLPETIGWAAEDDQILHREPTRDVYSGYMTIYGKVSFSGVAMYNARKDVEPFAQMIRQEMRGLEQDLIEGLRRRAIRELHI